MANEKQHNKNILQEQNKIISLVESALKLAKAKGASGAEAFSNLEQGFSVQVRMGETDTVEYNREKSIAITVYFGEHKGSASTSDTQPDSIAKTVEAACNIAKFTAADPYAGLADKEKMAFNYPDLDLCHPWNIQPEKAIELALEAEKIGLAYDKRITNSEGVSVATYEGIYGYGNSHGFIGLIPSSKHYLSCAYIGQDAGAMQRDFDYSVARDPQDLQAFSKISISAADKTIKRLNAKRLKTQKAPILFQAEVARSLLTSFTSAVSGGNLYRKSSFLLDSLGKTIFPEFITIHENPHLKKGIGSAPFDNEGVKTQSRDIIKNGVLQGYFLSSYSARRLGMETTGHAGGVYNLKISNADKNFAALIKQMNKGLIVTEVMGQGVNIVTGDYSRGASGFWVENGEIQYPVEEITIAGNLKDMFANIVVVGNDMDARSHIQTGSILIDEMMLAGE